MVCERSPNSRPTAPQYLSNRSAQGPLTERDLLQPNACGGPPPAVHRLPLLQLELQLAN